MTHTLVYSASGPLAEQSGSEKVMCAQHGLICFRQEKREIPSAVTVYV